MSVAINQGGESTMIQLSGDIGIAIAGDLKATLLDALKSGREVRVSLDGVTALDVTAFQLLWSAQREAVKKGLKFALTPESREPFKSLLQCMGLDGSLAR